MQGGERSFRRSFTGRACDSPSEEAIFAVVGSRPVGLGGHWAAVSRSGRSSYPCWSVFPMRRLHLDRRCATAFGATHDVIVAVPVCSHRRPFPLSPLLVLWHDGTTGERAPLIRFWPLQRFPVAWPCSGAASLRRYPAAALDSPGERRLCFASRRRVSARAVCRLARS